MLRGRLLEDRLISPFVKSGIINEYDAYNAIENIETWPTADVCHKELELFE
jgi:hypothetical protein